VTLHHAALQRWGKRCPCCDRVMTRTRPVKPGRLMPVDMATRGHDAPMARGGNYRDWVLICWQCNNDQGILDFASWQCLLAWRRDERERHVMELVIFIQQWRLKRAWKEAAE
jgi:hypothetical protein